MITRNMTYIYLLISVLTWPLTTMGDCSDALIRKLSNQGKTITDISKRCERAKEDVLSILQDDSETPPIDQTGYFIPSGRPVSQCGCWGPATPGARIPDQRCQAGVAVAVACNAYCPNGSLAWRTFCQ